MDIHLRFTIDERVVRGLRWAKRVSTRRRVAAFAALALLTSSLLVAADPVTKPHEFTAGTPIRAADVNENFDVLYEALERAVIRDDEIIVVGPAGGCDAIEAALAGLDGRSIASGASVRIQVEPGTYACARSLAVGHADGERITIAGAGTAPEMVELTFPAEASGIVVRSALGLLTNLTLTGAGGDFGNGSGVHADASRVRVERVMVRRFENGLWVAAGRIAGSGVTLSENLRGAVSLRGGALDLAQAVARDNAQGFHITQGGTARLRDAQAIENSAQGFHCDRGSSTTLELTSLADGNGASGFSVGLGASMSIEDATASSNGGNGFVASEGSSMSVGDATASGNGASGFAAHEGSVLRLSSSSTSTDNESHGYHVTSGSTLLARGSSAATGNARWGFRAETTAYMQLTGPFSASGNGDGDYEPTPGGFLLGTIATF